MGISASKCKLTYGNKSTNYGAQYWYSWNYQIIFLYCKKSNAYLVPGFIGSGSQPQRNKKPCI